ncbi:MAG: hypothetical protein AB7G93_21940 [Bdellovibrionales bacterium]
MTNIKSPGSADETAVRKAATLDTSTVRRGAGDGFGAGAGAGAGAGSGMGAGAGTGVGDGTGAGAGAGAGAGTGEGTGVGAGAGNGVGDGVGVGVGLGPAPFLPGFSSCWCCAATNPSVEHAHNEKINRRLKLRLSLTVPPIPVPQCSKDAKFRLAVRSSFLKGTASDIVKLSNSL